MAGLLAAAATAVRLPFQADVLVNFDAVNFALGLDGFDLRHHEPHPPGYLGYLLLVRPVDWLVEDANRALTLVSAVAAGIAVALLYLLARRFAGTVSSAVVAVLFALSPLAWYYGIVAVSYMPGAAAALAVAWAACTARFDASRWHLHLAAALLALLGALRQTDMVLLAPLVAYAASAFPRRVQLQAAALAAVLTAAWLVPLLWLSGGPVEYVAESRDLAILAGGHTSVFGLDPGGLARNGMLVVAGLVFGTFAALVPLILTYRRGLFARDERRFLLLWTVPSLVVFVLVHTGQVGYVLLVVPAFHVVLARALDEGRPVARRIGPRIAGLALVALVALDVVGFAVLPGAAVEATRRGEGISTPLGTIPLPDAAVFMAMDVRSNDEHWRHVIEWARRADPETTAVLSVVRKSGSFRHLTYYLPEHRLYAMGEGLHGGYGHLFTAHHHDTDYTVDGLDDPTPVLHLPEKVRQVLVLDQQPAGLDTDLPSTWERLPDGSAVLSIRVPTGASLRLEEGPPVRISAA